MRVVAIIQARLGSARFPHKALADIGGKPMIRRVVEQVKQMPGLADIVVATPASDAADIALALGDCRVAVFGPDVPDGDVLARYVETAKRYKADAILRVTGDCPLWNPFVGNSLLGQFYLTCADYVSNDVTISGYPDGEDCEIFTKYLLDAADRNVWKDDVHAREHVTPWMKQSALVVRALMNKPGTVGPSTEKWSVDTPEDLERVRARYALAR